MIAGITVASSGTPQALATANDSRSASTTIAARSGSLTMTPTGDRVTANACGVPLDATVIPAIMKANQAIPGEIKSSMLEDLERGRPLELPFLSGMVVKLGEDHGVPTPVHRFIATALKPFVNGAR